MVSCPTSEAARMAGANGWCSAGPMPSTIAESIMAISANSGLGESTLINSHAWSAAAHWQRAALRTKRLPSTATIVRVSNLPCEVMVMSTVIPLTLPSR